MTDLFKEPALFQDCRAAYIYLVVSVLLLVIGLVVSFFKTPRPTVGSALWSFGGQLAWIAVVVLVIFGLCAWVNQNAALWIVIACLVCSVSATIMNFSQNTA